MRVGRGARRAVVAACAALALAVAMAGCSADAAAPTPVSTAKGALPHATQKQLRTAVADAMTAAGASGAIVGVWVPWSGTWVAGLGTTGGADGQAVTPDMTFRAGDITRAMTCDMLYGLAAKGTVHLDDDVAQYVSGVPNLHNVTLQQLCNGTSGIGSYASQLLPLALANPDRQWNATELAGYGLAQVNGEVRPGVAYRDSDAGYLLLGLALERASGQTASQLLRTYVSQPLHLGHTVLPGAGAADPVVDGSTPLPGYYLTPKTPGGAYQCDKPTDITRQSASFTFTSAGVVSDIQDLGTYVHTLATGGIVSTKGRLQHALPLATDAPSWMTTTGGLVKADSLVGQYGSAPGYLTAAFSDADSGLTVAVVLNDSTAGGGLILDLARELAAIASKTPVTRGADAVAVGLPWTAQQNATAIQDAAVCAPPAKSATPAVPAKK